MLLTYQVCLIIASCLSYSNLESISKVNQLFNQIFNNRLKAYKTFYDSLTWNRHSWDIKLNDYFDIVVKTLFENLPYEKIFRIKLLRSRFLRSLTPQSILYHVCFCRKANNPGRYHNKCMLCCPVSFYDSELFYFEHFHTDLSNIEVRTAKNLYKNQIFLLFGKTPNWYHTVNSDSIVHLTDPEQFLNEFACTIMKIFCNNFLSDNFFYADFPLYQFLFFRCCLFVHSKKILLQISAYMNRKFLIFVLNTLVHTLITIMTTLKY